jgi:hypothetical protein
MSTYELIVPGNVSDLVPLLYVTEPEPKIVPFRAADDRSVQVPGVDEE